MTTPDETPDYTNLLADDDLTRNLVREFTAQLLARVLHDYDRGDPTTRLSIAKAFLPDIVRQSLRPKVIGDADEADRSAAVDEVRLLLRDTLPSRDGE